MTGERGRIFRREEPDRQAGRVRLRVGKNFQKKDPNTFRYWGLAEWGSAGSYFQEVKYSDLTSFFAPFEPGRPVE